MTALTDELVAIVHEVLGEFGQTITFARATGQTYSPASGNMSGGSQTIFSGYGYPWPYTELERANTLIKTEDDRLIVEKVTQVPLPGDQVSFNGKAYRVIEVDQITMSGEKIAYQLRVRE